MLNGTPSAKGRTSTVTFPHRCRDIALSVEHAPQIHMIVVLDIEDEIGIASEPATTKAGHIQIVSIAWRTDRGIGANRARGGLHSVDEADRDALSGLIAVPLGSLLHILESLRPGNDALRGHPV